ncbi:DUF4440 domain-containing protein [Streptomyces sp. NBC_00094]|uniref:DUF4440 domain-containing protein n=1 Tax=Streptomyces sp. NBC_00094 TaxID=2903620 RepID=UPI002257DF5B|nr:DUF4440 domain-containing protein [Streptomyces sp. NBC_00094]MCX5389622.1 DUF4440 domain-containing protein [Streptomyces sp. NBC_00094]
MHDDTFPAALTRRFDADQERLRAVALRMTGSRAEAEEALATARTELGRDGGVLVRAWLAAHVGRVCVRGLQERTATGQQGRGAGGGVRDAGADGGVGTVGAGEAVRGIGAGEAVRGIGAGEAVRGIGAGEAVRGVGASEVLRGVGAGVDSVWLALLVVLESLGSQERLAYVLHDLFGLPPHETARITGGSPVDAARLARRVRERVRGGGAARTKGDPGRQRAVVERFLAAARARDARALAAVLDPDVVAYGEHGPVHGAPAVSEAAAAFARLADVARPALVDGAVGLVAFGAGGPVAAVAFTLRQDRIVVLDIATGENRVRALDLAFPDW